LGRLGEIEVPRYTLPAKSFGLATVMVEEPDETVPASPRLKLPGLADIWKLFVKLNEYNPHPLTSPIWAKYVPVTDATNEMPVVAPGPKSCF
jgi:hypothetical protein